MNHTMFYGGQNLNKWVEMLHELYGVTQNYSKSVYEVHTHLTEVCGVFAKHMFKKSDYDKAREFLPKMFAWGVALLKVVHPNENDLEQVILRKFPGVCPYCGESPCTCWNKEKPTLDNERVRNDYYRNAKSIRRSVNDFQLMFENIYGSTWDDFNINHKEDHEKIRTPFTRMVEELSEIAEAIRFNHLYPENFENELADFFAWWFCIVSCFPKAEGSKGLLAENILWQAYPGFCPYCELIPCFCRPGPVRELMSKPAPGQDHKFDLLTALYNQGAFKEDIEYINNREMLASLPIAS